MTGKEPVASGGCVRPNQLFARAVPSQSTARLSLSGTRFHSPNCFKGDETSMRRASHGESCPRYPGAETTPGK